MVAAQTAQRSNGSIGQKQQYNNYFLDEDAYPYIPPYFKDTPETPEGYRCQIVGDGWPKWLSGSFVRVGEGIYTVPLSEDGSKPAARLQHFFDGLATIHKFDISGGNVHYTSKHTANGVVRNAKKNGYISTGMFGKNANTPLLESKDPCSQLLGARMSFFVPPPGHPAPDDININVSIRRGISIPDDHNPKSRGGISKNPTKDDLLVMTDFNFLQVLDAKSLEPKRLLTYAALNEELEGFGICAHPPHDRARQTTYNYLISKKGELFVFGISNGEKDPQLQWKTKLPAPPCYVHSLAMTQKYVIFIHQPVAMDVSDMTVQMIDALKLIPDQSTSFFILDKENGELIAKYDSPAFTFFHSINAYDYVDSVTGKINIHVDLCSYKAESLTYKEYCLSNIVDPAAPFQQGTIVRYEMAGVDAASSRHDGSRRATVKKVINSTTAELPRIRKDMSTNPNYRFVYAIGENGGACPETEFGIGKLGTGLVAGQAGFFGNVIKADWQTGKHQEWRPSGGDTCPCEPIFIERPGGTAEDDGVVLTIILDRSGKHSSLVALDGQTLQELGRAVMPQVYGIGPHGTFISGTDMFRE